MFLHRAALRTHGTILKARDRGSLIYGWLKLLGCIYPNVCKIVDVRSGQDFADSVAKSAVRRSESDDLQLGPIERWVTDWYPAI